MTIDSIETEYSSLQESLKEDFSGVHRIEVPTPFPVGSVNCYLIEGNPLTLVDNGPRTDELWISLTHPVHNMPLDQDILGF